MIYGTVLHIFCLFVCLHSLFSIYGLFSPMLKGPHGPGSFFFFLPFYHLTLLQNSETTNYEAGNQMSKPLKTASEIHTTVL